MVGAILRRKWEAVLLFDKIPQAGWVYTTEMDWKPEVQDQGVCRSGFFKASLTCVLSLVFSLCRHISGVSPT